MAQHRTKAQRIAEHDAIAARWPKGSHKGDALAKVQPLGNSHRAINSMMFSSVAKSGALKIWGNK